MIILTSLGSIYWKLKMRLSPTFYTFKLWLKNNLRREIRAFTNHLLNHGITHRVSCSHTPLQNSRVERKNKHVVKMRLSLLAHFKMPLSYWPYAFQTISNVSSCQTLYVVPNYSFLKVFGCSNFPFLRPYNQHKLQFRLVKCVFLGCNSKHKGYLCLDILFGKIYISRHVIFLRSFSIFWSSYCFIWFIST